MIIFTNKLLSNQCILTFDLYVLKRIFAKCVKFQHKCVCIQSIPPEYSIMDFTWKKKIAFIVLRKSKMDAQI